MAETFGQYGHSFQTKALILLLDDKAFLQQIIDILKKDYFETEPAQWIFVETMKYYDTYKKPPTFEVFSILIDEVKSEVLHTSIKNTLKEMWESRNAADLDFVRDNALEFCKNQELKTAVIESVDLLERKDYDAMRIRLDKAFKAGSDKNIGHIYKINLEERMSDASRMCVATPWDAINEITDGGSSPGDLFVVVAPPGIGKTWGLVSAGSFAARKGLNVNHYSMELNEHYVGRRYDANLTGISSQNLKYHKEEVEHALRGMTGDVIIKYYPPKVATVATIRAHLDKCILLGYKPDLVIVDYADLLRSHSTSREVRHALENIYEDLRSMAGEFEVPVWTASQANRSSVEQDVIGAEKIAEAFSKVMVADFVMSLSRKITDKVAGTARWHIIKNRFGPDGMTFPSKFNTATGHIQIYEESTQAGRDTKKEIDKSSLYTRQLLKKKRDQMDADEDEQRSTNGFEE